MAARKKKITVDQTKVVTTGTTFRLEEAKSSRQRKPSATLVVQEMNPASGFLDWLREHAVVGLAIGIIIGSQVQVVARQLIDSFINPLFTLFFGVPLSQRTLVLHFHDRSSVITWGAFVYSLLSFLFVLLVIYIIIKILQLDKFDKPKKK